MQAVDCELKTKYDWPYWHVVGYCNRLFSELLAVCKVVVSEGTNNTFDAHIICICCCASVCRKQNFVKNSVRSSITYLNFFYEQFRDYILKNT